MEAERKKAKAAMDKGDMEIAKIHAEGTIRLKKEAIGTRRYGAKMGALASKLDGAVRAQQISQTMANTVPALQKSLKTMEKMGIAGAMQDFEKVFEDLDVKTGEIDSAMDNVYQGSIDQTEVQGLLTEIAGGVALNAEGSMGNAVG